MKVLSGTEILEGVKNGRYPYDVERTLRSFIEYKVFVTEWNSETIIRVHKSDTVEGVMTNSEIKSKIMDNIGFEMLVDGKSFAGVCMDVFGLTGTTSLLGRKISHLLDELCEEGVLFQGCTYTDSVFVRLK